jgi:hypothetical protein
MGIDLWLAATVAGPKPGLRLIPGSLVESESLFLPELLFLAALWVLASTPRAGLLAGQHANTRYLRLQLHVAVPAYSQVTHSVRVMQVLLTASTDFASIDQTGTVVGSLCLPAVSG